MRPIQQSPGVRAEPGTAGGRALRHSGLDIRVPATLLAVVAALVACSPGGSEQGEPPVSGGSEQGEPPVSGGSEQGEPQIPGSPPDSGLPASVLMSGNSLTEGWHATTEERSFRGLVGEWLGGTEAVTGTHAAGFTVQEVADGFEVPRGVDVAVVELGTNDLARNNPVDTFGVQYAAYLDDLVQASPGVRLVCLGVWYPASEGTAGFDAVINSECTRRGGVFEPLSGLFGEAGLRGPEGRSTWLGGSDVFHPNDAGHERIAELVKERISALESKG